MPFFANITRDRILLLIVILVLLVHVGSFAYLDALSARNPDSAYPVLKGDSERYISLAGSLLSEGAFAIGGIPERHTAPGYPFFLAAVESVSRSWELAIALQIALALLAVALIYKIALRYLPPAFAAIPAFLYGIDPNVVLSDTVLLSDGIFSSLLVVAIYLAFFRKWEGNEILRFASVAALIGIAALTRSIAQFLIPLVGAALLVGIYRAHRKNLNALSGPIIAYALVSFLVVGTWVIWTHEKFGAYEIAHVGASNLLYHNARDFMAWKAMNEREPVPAFLSSRYRDDPAFALADSRIAGLLARTPEGDDPRNYEGPAAASVILEDPLSYAYYHLVNTLPFFIGSSIASYKQAATQIEKGEGFYAPTALLLKDALSALLRGRIADAAPALPIILEVLLWAAAATLALFALWRKRRDARIWILACLVAYFALLTGPVSIVRYRIPAEPYMLILAIIGAHALLYRQERGV